MVPIAAHVDIDAAPLVPPPGSSPNHPLALAARGEVRAEDGGPWHCMLWEASHSDLFLERNLQVNFDA